MVVNEKSRLSAYDVSMTHYQSDAVFLYSRVCCAPIMSGALGWPTASDMPGENNPRPYSKDSTDRGLGVMDGIKQLRTTP